MLSRGGDEIELESNDTRSLSTAALQDHAFPSLQQSPRSKSAGARRTEYEMTTIYPLEVQVNRLALEQEPDAWAGEETEERSSSPLELSKSNPNLKTTPLILTPLPFTRPATAAPVISKKNNRVAPSPTPSRKNEPLQIPSSDIWTIGDGSSVSVVSDRTPSPAPSPAPSPSLPRWKRNRVHPSPCTTAACSPDPSSSAGTNRESSIIEEATGEEVIKKQLSSHQLLEDYALPPTPRVFSNSLGPNHTPYIPLHCAEQALTAVVADMQTMKARHVEIMHDILNEYNALEADSRSRYRGVVQGLREQHYTKVGAYKEVVRALQVELDNSNGHWDSTVKSIGNRNQELLEENQALYQRMRDVLERTQKDKERTNAYYTKRLEKERAKYERGMSNARDMVQQLHKKAEKRMALLEERSLVQLSKEGASHSKALKELETELEQTQEELEKVKEECESMKNSLSTAQKSPNIEEKLSVIKTDFPSIESKAMPISTEVEVKSSETAIRDEKSPEIVLTKEKISADDIIEPSPNDANKSAAAKVLVPEETAAASQFELSNHSIALSTISETGELAVEKIASDVSVDEEGTVTPYHKPADETEAADESITSDIEEDDQISDTITVEQENNLAENKDGGDKNFPSSLQEKDSQLNKECIKLRKQIADLKKQHQADVAKIKSIEKELARGSVGNRGTEGGASIEEKRELKRKEKELKDAKKQCDIAKNNLSKIQSQLKSVEAELASIKKDNEKLSTEIKLKETELKKLSIAAKDGVAALEKLQQLQEVTKKQSEEISKLVTSFNSERILRKKYYNMIEDMKGKIRVYCRVRPLSSSEKARKDQSVVDSPDEYSVHVKTSRTTKEYQFDQIFTPEHSQEKVFEDTKNLIQSAVDGYNVCIFAYGQTGSGKTYTMIGGKDAAGVLTAPGIAPRAFDEIYQLLEANKEKFSFKVACYMLELYNDRLIDLFNPKGKEPTKLDIKKDKKGMVVIQGSISHPVDSAQHLMDIFELGSKNRHISSTKMNAESSRSHLIVGIVIESTNRTNGSVHKGKLSIVDLAGSERASKTGATPEQLKEAQSINKSLSALGDVISALSSGQDFVPYRNNRLTLLMQDSLGGNAKTLMFVNISPADYNSDETVTSLTYAARVKLISNDASKNAENKEITRLKGIIAKLKKGEEIGEDDVEL